MAERWSRVSGACKTEVSPHGALVRTTPAKGWTADSSTQTMVRCSLGSLFEGPPMLGGPGGDGRLVVLGGPKAGLLDGPAAGPEQATDMRWVVADAELVLDYGG